MDPSALEGRVVELEQRYMRLEKTVDDLSGVVAAQQKHIDHLERELGSLLQRLGAFEPGPNEPPPHY